MFTYEQVSSYYKILAEDELHIRKRLDVNRDYFRVFSDCNNAMDMQYSIHLEKIITFLREYMPNLSELSLRYCPTVLTLANLIQVFLEFLIHQLQPFIRTLEQVGVFFFFGRSIQNGV